MKVFFACDIFVNSAISDLAKYIKTDQKEITMRDVYLLTFDTIFIHLQIQIKSLEYTDSWKLQIELMNIHGVEIIFHATCEISYGKEAAAQYQSDGKRMGLEGGDLDSSLILSKLANE